jgi:ACS family hexuronate transporter-like MFS transporter
MPTVLPLHSAPARALAIAVLAQTTVSIAEMGVPTLAPFFQRDFALSATGIGFMISAVSVGRVLGSLPAGRLVDQVGENAVMVGGGLGAALLFALAAASPAWWSVAAALGVAGVFTGSAGPAGTKFIISAFPPHRRGLPMGIRQSAVPLGGLLAAVTLPLLAQGSGLHAALLVSSGVLVVGAAGALVGMPAPAAVTRAVQEPHALSGFALIRSDRDIRLAIVWAMLFIGGQYAVVSYLILDLTGHVGVSLATATAMLAVAQSGGLVGRVLWGAVSDRRFGGRRKPPLLLITVGGLVSVVLLALLPHHEPTVVLVLICLLAGATLIAWQGVWTGLMSELAPASAIGTTVGFGLTFTNVAIVSWPPLFGFIADRTGDFRASWVVLAGALVASAIVLAVLVEPSPLNSGERHEPL